MRGLLIFLAVMAAAFPAWSRPRVTPPNGTKPYAVTVMFAAGDTEDSEAIPVSGFCSARYQQSSGDDASLYAVPTAETAASSGTLIKAFTASSTTAPTTFIAGTRWVKAVATDATAGGSVMVIECAPLVGGGGGSEVLYADLPSSGYPPVATVTDCASTACNAGGGSTRVVMYWDGDSYEPISEEPREQILHKNNFLSNFTMTTWSTSTCLGPYETTSMKTIVSCTGTTSRIAFGDAVTITKLRWIAINDQGDANTGCDVRLSTDGGSNLATGGAVLNIPAIQGDPITAGDVATATQNITLTPGQAINLQVQDGTNCDAGSTCDCVGGRAYGTLEVWGLMG